MRTLRNTCFLLTITFLSAFGWVAEGQKSMCPKETERYFPGMNMFSPFCSGTRHPLNNSTHHKSTLQRSGKSQKTVAVASSFRETAIDNDSTSRSWENIVKKECDNNAMYERRDLQFLKLRVSAILYELTGSKQRYSFLSADTFSLDMQLNKP